MTLNRPNILYLLLFMAIPQFIFAEEPMKLDIEKSIELALENNLTFQSSAVNLETARRDNANSWSNFLPDTDLSAGLYNTFLETDDEPYSYYAQGSLSLSLDLNPSLKSTIEYTKLAYESEQISYEQAQELLIVSVEEEFYYLLTSESNLDIEKKNSELTDRIYEQTLSDYNNGLTSELDLLQARYNAASLVPDYSQTVATHNAYLRSFLVDLGLDPRTSVELVGDLNTDIIEIDGKSLMERYLVNRSDIRAAQKALESKRNNKKLETYSDRFPTLSLSTDYTGSLDDDNEYTDYISLDISLSIPLDSFIPGSQDDLTIKGLDDDIKEAQISLKNTISEAKLEVINLIAQLKTSEENLALSRMNIDLAAETYDVYVESYDKGTVERLDVEDAQQDLLEANQSYLSNQYNYLVSLIDLRSALDLDSLKDLQGDL